MTSSIICPNASPIAHEHCPLHGCVEYVCCVPKEGPDMEIVLVDEWTGMEVEWLKEGFNLADFPFGARIDFDDRTWAVVKIERPTATRAKVWLRLVDPK